MATLSAAMTALTSGDLGALTGYDAEVVGARERKLCSPSWVR